MKNKQESRRSAKQSRNGRGEITLMLTKLMFPSVNIGEVILTRIPEVDTCETDRRNIIAVLGSKEKINLHRRNTKHSTFLKKLYKMKDFTLFKEALIQK